MPFTLSDHRQPSFLKLLWQRHGLLLLVLLVLSIIAALSRALLSATLIEGNPVNSTTNTVIERRWPEACTSSGSMFDVSVDPTMDVPYKVINKYVSLASAVFEEREEHLQKPSRWKCNAQTFDQMMPPSPRLRSLAAQLPAWNGQVTFSSFPQILSEFQRIYECKLLEMQQDAVPIVIFSGSDIIPAQPVEGFNEVVRMEVFTAKLDEEKMRSRLAIERSLNTIRSFEIVAPFSVEMNCLQREAVDLRIGLSLLSDTVSCLPSVWDISTSLHDRDGE